mgnify:CR=1 FL=1
MRLFSWNVNGINKGALNIENYYNTDKTPVKSVRQQKSQHKFSPLADIQNVEVIHRIQSILNWFSNDSDFIPFTGKDKTRLLLLRLLYAFINYFANNSVFLQITGTR